MKIVKVNQFDTIWTFDNEVTLVLYPMCYTPVFCEGCGQTIKKGQPLYEFSKIIENMVFSRNLHKQCMPFPMQYEIEQFMEGQKNG